MSLTVDIRKHYNGFTLDVSFSAGNETLALLGASGCGKSLTLRCIAGIERPDEGHIELDGVTLFDSEKGINLPPQRRQTGLLFQNYALFPNMTVEQNILSGMRKNESSNEQKQKRLGEMLSRFELTGLSGHYPHQLSGGQQQRCALARILVSKPHVLLLDEPFSALDQHLRFTLERSVREVIHEFGKTVLWVSHDRDEVFRQSDRIAIMNAGHIDTIGTKHEVFRNPVTAGGAALTGCKNISRIRRISDTLICAEDFGLILPCPSDLPENCTFCGFRMHDIKLADPAVSEDPASASEQGVLCRVAEEIENPFSYTLMLVPTGQPEGLSLPNIRPFGLEITKKRWISGRTDRVRVIFPKSALLWLKE